MDTTDAPAQVASAPRAPRITNACEACRAAKVKCQASTQLGTCKRCLDSKRECIFKTGPRTRRPRLPKRPNPTTASTTTPSSSTPTPPAYPPLPGPSKTFTIDIPMSADNDIVDSLDALRLAHEQAIDMLVPHLSEGEGEDDEYGDYGYDYDQEMMGGGDCDWLDHASASGAGSVLSHASSLPLGASALSTPPSSAAVQGGGGGVKAKTKPLAGLRLQPQFNLDSAGKLLTRFREVMLAHFHCVVVGEGDTVPTMAKERPFVLLALLAAASGSRTLQGHSLYDEEFRKVLGLKFVAGGERTLELLQGLVIYISWYPFHLRPKNKPALQYIRMVVDIVSDLELDENPGTDSLEVPATPERLAEIRLYLASYYIASSFASTWGRSSSLTYTDYTARCSDLLQHHSPLPGDHVLAWQVRLQRLVEETNDLRRTQRGHSQSEYQINLMLRGMETQLTEWQARMAPALAATPSVRVALLFTRVFLSGAPLLKLPSVKLHPLDSNTNNNNPASTFGADPQRLMSIVPALHELYEYLLALPPGEITAFVGVEWTALIMAVILGFRMSLPLVVCPEWDDGTARGVVRFGEYIDRFCGLGGGGGGRGEDGASAAASSGKGGESVDVIGASRIVLEMVGSKFRKRVARLEAAAAAAAAVQQREQEQGQQQQQQQQQQGLEQEQHQHHQHHHHHHQQQQQVEAMLATATPTRRGVVPAHSGCPMMDGSLEPYYPYWDETFNSNLVTNAFVGRAEALGQGEINPAGAGVPNDLWTSMTMGWAQGGGDFDAL